MLDQIVVPDVAGSIVGRRCWGLAKTPGGIRLVSRNDTLWPTDAPLDATCVMGKSHQPPADKCSCGIYALNAESDFPYYMYEGKGYAVFGEVFLWGEVIQGSKGYRAQHAFPKALYLAHHDWRYAQPLRDAYWVPVHLQDPYQHQQTNEQRAS